MGMNNNQEELVKDLDLDEHIVCPLCRNFFSDAVTLARCLHSFCRKCLEKCPNFTSATSSLATIYKCPKCFVDLGPEPIYRRDQKLQEMTYKLVPDLLWRQIRKQSRRQHRRHSFGDSTHISERRIEQRKQLVQLSTQLCSANEKISIQINYVPLHTVLAANEEREEGSAEIVKLPEDPSGKHSFRRFLRCPSRVRIEQLRKLLELKLAMTTVYGVYFVDPTLRDVLEDEYSLEYLIEMFNWSRDGPFQLRFTLVRIPGEDEEEEHPPILEEMPQLDMESGPMERPKHQQEHSPTKIDEEMKTPQMNTTTIMNTNKRNKMDEKKKETTLAADGHEANNKKDEVLSTSGPSSSRQKVPQCSPPTTNKMPIPRLSTAGVSPLRPVPSLLGIPAVTDGNQQQTTTSKKRKRNSSTVGEKAKLGGQGQSPAQKMLKFGPNLKTKETEEKLEMMTHQPPASVVENEVGPKIEMNKVDIGEEGKEEKQPKEHAMMLSTSAAAVENNAKDIPSFSSAQTELSTIIKTPQPPIGQQKTQKEKKKRPSTNPKPKAATQNSSAKKVQNQTKTSPPSFTMCQTAQSNSSQSMVGGVNDIPAAPQIHFNPHQQQFGSMPILPQMQNQPQQQYAQIFQNLLQNRQANEAFGAAAVGFLQNMSPQQVQTMQTMMAMALAAGAVQQQSQGGQQQQKAMMTPTTMQLNKTNTINNNNKGSSAVAKQSNGTVKLTSNNTAKVSPPKLETMLAPSTSTKSIQQQKIVVSSSPSINASNMILNPTMLTAAAMKVTMPS